MSGQHTQGRLEVGPEVHGTKMLVCADHPQLAVACYLTESDARRLAACWNLMESIDTDTIEQIGAMYLVHGWQGEYKLRQELDAKSAELATARALLAEVVQLHDAENIAACHNDEPLISCEFYEEIDRIRAFLKGDTA